MEHAAAECPDAAGTRSIRAFLPKQGWLCFRNEVVKGGQILTLWLWGQSYHLWPLTDLVLGSSTQKLVLFLWILQGGAHRKLPVAECCEAAWKLMPRYCDGLRTLHQRLQKDLLSWPDSAHIAVLAIVAQLDSICTFLLFHSVIRFHLLSINQVDFHDFCWCGRTRSQMHGEILLLFGWDWPAQHKTSELFLVKSCAICLWELCSLGSKNTSRAICVSLFRRSKIGYRIRSRNVRASKSKRCHVDPPDEDHRHEMLRLWQ